MDPVVWWARPTATSDAQLTDDERARLDALRRPEDRSAFRSAHVLARDLVASVTGVGAERVVLWARCERCGGPHGVPHVLVDGDDGPLVSLARCREAVIVAVASTPIGVDVEALGGTRAGLADVALSPGEIEQLESLPPDQREDALTRWWVRKEAVLKSAGTGLDVDPRSVVVTAPVPGVVLHDLDLAADLAACLAVRTTETVPVDVVQVELS